MRRRLPNQRFLEIAEAVESSKEPSEHPYESGLFFLLKDNQVISEDVEGAFAIYEDEEFRHVLDALILAKATDEQIYEGLEIFPFVTKAYRHLFCDRTAFRHSLDVTKYVNALDVDPKLKDIYINALQKGPDYVINIMRVGKRPDVDPRVIIRAMTADFYDRFLSHRGNSITSDVAKEALKWGKEAVSGAIVLIDKDTNKMESALEDLKLVLKTKDLTATEEEAGINLQDVITG